MNAPATPAAEDLLRLDRQVCFRLYAASRLVTRLYLPLLEPLGLTYPQYIVMMILWEDAPCTVSHIGARAMLASNTLTPLLKRLEQAGHIRRARSAHDERVVDIHLTESGQALRSRCLCVPTELLEKTGAPVGELIELARQLDGLLARLSAAVPPESGG